MRQQARRIDRSMIGSPTNFQHTGHIGSGDVDMGNSHLRAIQNQMQSKGGYETAFSTVKVKCKGCSTALVGDSQHVARLRHCSPACWELVIH